MKYYAIVTDKHIFKDFICREKEFCALIAFEENDKQAVYGLFSAQFSSNTRNIRKATIFWVSIAPQLSMKKGGYMRLV